jgi:predicted DNA-binding transcriptional regulator AlpA
LTLKRLNYAIGILCQATPLLRILLVIEFIENTSRRAKMNTTAPATDDPDRLVDERQAAEFLAYSVRALQNWRVRGGGPRFVKVSGRSIRYRRRDLIDWIEARLRSNTSEAA